MLNKGIVFSIVLTAMIALSPGAFAEGLGGEISGIAVFQAAEADRRLAVATALEGYLGLLEWDGESLSVTGSVPLGTYATGPAVVQWDGRILIAAADPEGQVHLFDPASGQPKEVRVNPSAGNPWALVAGDIDGDGGDELLVAFHEGNGGRIVSLGAGGPELEIKLDFLPGDLIPTTGGLFLTGIDGRVGLLREDGFSAISLPPARKALAWDADADGREEILLHSVDDAQRLELYSLTEGSTGLLWSQELPERLDAMAVLDVGSGRSVAVVVLGGKIYYLHHLGGNPYWIEGEDTGDRPAAVTGGDLDGDGRLEIVTGVEEPRVFATPYSRLEDLAKPEEAPAILRLVGEGILSGYGDGTFRPRRGLTRAEAAKVLVRAAGIDPGGEAPLADLPEHHWARPYIGAAFEAGLMRGTGEGLFEPDRRMTRLEFLVALGRLLGWEAEAVTLGVDLSPWFKDHYFIPPWGSGYVQLAIEAGIINPGDRCFRPQEEITRGQAALWLSRAT